MVLRCGFKNMPLMLVDQCIQTMKMKGVMVMIILFVVRDKAM